jgi:hypothetical protein
MANISIIKKHQPPKIQIEIKNNFHVDKSLACRRHKSQIPRPYKKEKRGYISATPI